MLFWKKRDPINSIKLIERGINTCNEMAEKAYFMKFEIGWFKLSQLNWKEAETYFEMIFIYSIDISFLSTK